MAETDEAGVRRQEGGVRRIKISEEAARAEGARAEGALRRI